MLPKLFLILKAIGVIFSLTFWRLKVRIQASIHHWTYRTVADPKNVVVVGGSFAGFFLAKQLALSLPTGYRAIVIEKHSHYHFTWNFPRISVISGHTQNAFIPYPTQPSLAPSGAYLFRQGEVIKIETNKVILADGSSIPFEYLAIATGSKARYPGKLDADGKAECINFFEERQARIKAAESIVIVGGGAAGVELAGDIKSKYSGKQVTLVHSRKQLLNSFGSDLHEVAQKTLEELGVDLCLGERVTAGLDREGSTEVVLNSGKRIQCDALVSIIDPFDGLVTCSHNHRFNAQDNALARTLLETHIRPLWHQVATSPWSQHSRSKGLLEMSSPVGTLSTSLIRS